MSRPAAVGLCLVAVLLAACAPYRLEGEVIDGGASDLVLGVAAAPGAPASTRAIEGATVRVFRDPNRPSRVLAGTARSGPDGRFVLEIDGFGAGWMEETWLVEAIAPGRVPVSLEFALPARPKGRRLLVVLAPGRGDAVVDPQLLRDADDPWKTIDRYR